MENGRVLVDISRSGRARPWREHKANSVLLSESFRRLGKENKAVRVRECGSVLTFGVCPEGHEKRLLAANFCRVRLCPMCSWRRSILVAHQVRLVAHEAAIRKPLRWLFLTVTVRNCLGDELKNTLNWMMKSWNRFVGRKAFEKVVIGWFRSLEITRNPVDGTYHPHFHVLLAVPPRYFKGKDYLTHADWVTLWQTALKVDYTPVVDVRTVKDKRDVQREKEILEEKGIELVEADGELPASAVAEIAKYSVKAEDYLVYRRYRHKQEGKKIVLAADKSSGIDESVTDRVVEDLDSAMKGRRFIAYGGLLKEIWQELQRLGRVQDAESESVDLVHVEGDESCQCSVCGSSFMEEVYRWIPALENYFA